MIVVGGGATARLAIDAATRGYDVLLLERATSAKHLQSQHQNWRTAACAIWSRGNIGLVMEG